MGRIEQDSSLRVVINSPYPLRKERPDGVTQFITELSPHLKDKGCVVRLVGPHIRDEEHNAADYTLGRTVRLTHNNTQLQSTVSFNKGLAKDILLTTRPDVVVFHEPLAGHVAHTIISSTPQRQDGQPIPVFIGHFHARAESLDFLTRFAFQVAKRTRRIQRNGRFSIGLTPGYISTVLGSLDGRIAVSNATAKFWERRYPGKHEIIYNGIDTDLLTPDGPIIPQWQDGKKTILFAGRHDPRKGIDDLIIAFAAIRRQRNDVKLKITGEGQMTKKLQTLVRQLQVPDVEFVGILPRFDPFSELDLVRAYRTADVFVSPATGGEGFGRTLAEALSSGTLTVGTDIDGYREVIGGKPFARSAKPRDTYDIARKITEVIDLPEGERLNLQQSARYDIQQRFSWPIIAGETVRYYETCLNEHGRPLWPKKERQRNTSGIIFDRTQL